MLALLQADQIVCRELKDIRHQQLLLTAVYVPDALPVFFVFDPLLGCVLVNDIKAPIALGKEIGSMHLTKIFQLWEGRMFFPIQLIIGLV